jgi:outer membrane protein OmpA-like peptidoglycan-associated protein
MRRSVILVALGAAFALCGAARSASAQGETNIDVERFHPATTTDGFVTVEGSGVRSEADRWAFGLFANYALQPLVVVNAEDGLENAYVAHRLGFDLLASVTVVGPFALGLDVPFFVPQLGDGDASVGGLGDVRLVPKLRLLDDRDHFGLGVIAELRVPTHVGDFAGGARNVVFVPRLVADHRFGASGVRFGANVGASLRERTSFANVEAASEFVYSAALDWRIGGPTGLVTLGLEAFGGVGLYQADAEELPLEGLLYAKLTPDDEWEVSFGPGMGLVPGYGVPTFRGFAGVRYTPTAHDRDHDGVPDDEDLCPDLAEDRDGDADSDGCPEEEADDDQDGVPNVDDDCPNQKETINGLDDEDGCPDTGEGQVAFMGGRITTIENVRFRVSSAQIDPQSYSMLKQVALILKAHPEIKHIRVEGHTDDTGERDMNVRLSKARAESVKRYLMARGVKPDRLSSEGYGPDRPLVQGTDAQARAKNRRVEFILER